MLIGRTYGTKTANQLVVRIQIVMRIGGLVRTFRQRWHNLTLAVDDGIGMLAVLRVADDQLTSTRRLVRKDDDVGARLRLGSTILPVLVDRLRLEETAIPWAAAHEMVIVEAKACRAWRKGRIPLVDVTGELGVRWHRDLTTLLLYIELVLVLVMVAIAL